MNDCEYWMDELSKAKATIARLEMELKEANDFIKQHRKYLPFYSKIAASKLTQAEIKALTERKPTC